MKTKLIPILLILTLTLAGAALAAGTDDKWIHVRVQDGSGELVKVNFPLSLVAAAAAVIPDEVHAEMDHEMEIAFDELHMEWQDLLKFWEAVRDAPEATFVTVQTKTETVEVKKEGDYVLVNTTEASDHGTQIDVKFPLAVIDALLSGPEGRLNIEAALNALAAESDGHLVSVRDGDDTVQVWVDDKNEQE